MPATDLQPDLFTVACPAPVAAPAPALPPKPRWRRPRVSPAEVAHLVARLRGHGWQTRAELGLDDRELRLLAEASDGAVLSYPGSPGSRFFDDADKREWDRCDASFTAQIRAMARRRNAYRRRRKRVEEDRHRSNSQILPREASGSDAGF